MIMYFTQVLRKYVKPPTVADYIHFCLSNFQRHFT